MNRQTKSFLRRELLRQFRKKQIHSLISYVYSRIAYCANTEKPLTLPNNQTAYFDLSDLAPGIELHNSVPTGRKEFVDPALKQLREYEAELKAWKRKRTIARTKVAKYSRLVAYHRKKVKAVSR